MEPELQEHEMEIVLKATLVHAPNWKRGWLFLKFADTSPTFSDPDTGEEIGSLCGVVGGGLTAEIKVEYGTEGSHTEIWYLNPMDVFTAIMDERGDLSESFPEPEWEDDDDDDTDD
jgi:hypothetical protein